MSAERRWYGLGQCRVHAVFAVLVVALIAGCSDDPPECHPPVLANEQEEALVRATFATTEGMVAHAPDSPAAEIVAIASDHQAEHNDLVDPDPCRDRTVVLLDYPLVVADLVAHAETISPELEAGLTRAAQEGGAAGILTFLSASDVFYRSDFPGLGHMRDRLLVQTDRADEVFEALGPAESSSSED